MKKNERFQSQLGERVLLADGAMGTEIYRRGFYVNRCYDHLNITDPGIISEILGEYQEAGAEILTANTFGANRIHLTSFGLADQLADVIQRGVELAREAASPQNFIAGSVGPVSELLVKKQGVTPSQVLEAYREQIQSLAECGVDILTLETFTSWEELAAVYGEVQAIAPDIPCVLSLSVAAFGVSQEVHVTSSPEAAQELRAQEEENVLTPASAAERVRTLESQPENPPIFGLNCGGGPPEMLEFFKRLKKTLPESTRTMAMPNAGSPSQVDGRTLYLASPEYMAGYTRRFVNSGVNIIGGCCGTTPEMIREMRSYLRQMQPGSLQIAVGAERTEERLAPIPLEERSVWGRKLHEKFAVSVELDPPKGLDISKAVNGAKFLAEHGIDAVNIADGPRASGRINPVSLALRVREEAEIETIIHVCCRDRNILGLQMDLLSAHTLDIRNLMLITGDPPKMGLYPDSTAVFDMDSIGLIGFADLLNQGVDLALRPIGGQTSFVIGTGCNPGAESLELEVERFERKVNAGAEYVFSQPVYDIALLEEFLKRTEHIKRIPFFVGILPLASLRNAEFLTENIPGMAVPQEIRKRLALASTKEAQRKEGIAIAAEALRDARTMDRITGTYVFPPFGRYSSILDVLEQAL